ncbi:hypothetical protein XNC3_960001 [Xenorhabdus nematophila F1]|uniref:Uncharacterized protein n=1 Tax=Xenorhabdus bovienii str. feltiae Moldova TaxID=1398200 RepID=A0A077NNH1_XENBV|nr:hypothetical protein XNC3_960001 [Xenorhabdus nematophila F1]CDH00415.1 hypothetical protein XBFM1_1630013 [Xenorhabdus bovienii str. feltiae Moldova]
MVVQQVNLHSDIECLTITGEAYNLFQINVSNCFIIEINLHVAPLYIS